MKSLIVYIPLLISINSNSQSAADYFRQGKINYNNARYEQAIEQYNQAILLDSTDANYFLQRGFCKGLLKDYQGAIADYSSAIRLNPSDQFAYVSRGSAKSKIGNFSEAIDDFNQALVLDPDYAEAYNNRGFARKALGRFAEACEDWKISRKLGNEEAKIILKNNRCK